MCLLPLHRRSNSDLVPTSARHNVGRKSEPSRNHEGGTAKVLRM